MKMVRKVKCLKCEGVVEDNGSCSCKSVVLVEGKLVVGLLGIDAKDISQRLLSE